MDEHRLVRIAGAVLVALGAGHLALAAVLTRATLLGWAADGVWAAVPLLPGAAPAGARDALAFWGGAGGFAVPLVILGLLLRHLAGRGVRVPAFVGWTVAVWCLVGAVLLVPSPFAVGVVAGMLVVLAARRPRWEESV